MSTASFPMLLQTFFTDRLLRQLRASAHTIAAYRDTFRLLLRYAVERLRQPPTKLRIENLDAGFIGSFLDHLESAVATARARATCAWRPSGPSSATSPSASLPTLFMRAHPLDAGQAARATPGRFLESRRDRGPRRRSVQDDMDRPSRSGAPPGRGPDGAPFEAMRLLAGAEGEAAAPLEPDVADWSRVSAGSECASLL
jgi:hypothetical protein